MFTSEIPSANWMEYADPVNPVSRDDSWHAVRQTAAAEACPCFTCPARQVCVIQCVDYREYVG